MTHVIFIAFGAFTARPDFRCLGFKCSSAGMLHVKKQNNMLQILKETSAVIGGSNGYRENIQRATANLFLF
jgi:hypothetical protein